MSEDNQNTINSSIKPFRVRFTWGGGSWSFEYFYTLAEAEKSEIWGCAKSAYTVFGTPYLKYAQRTAIQQKIGSKWKTQRPTR